MASTTVQRTFRCEPEELWGRVLRRTDLGELRAAAPVDELRLRWQPARSMRPAAVSLTFRPASASRTALRVRVDDVGSPEAAEAARHHWRGVLASLG